MNKRLISKPKRTHSLENSEPNMPNQSTIAETAQAVVVNTSPSNTSSDAISMSRNASQEIENKSGECDGSWDLSLLEPTPIHPDIEKVHLEKRKAPVKEMDQEDEDRAKNKTRPVDRSTGLLQSAVVISELNHSPREVSPEKGSTKVQSTLSAPVDLVLPYQEDVDAREKLNLVSEENAKLGLLAQAIAKNQQKLQVEKPSNSVQATEKLLLLQRLMRTAEARSLLNGAIGDLLKRRVAHQTEAEHSQPTKRRKLV